MPSRDEQQHGSPHDVPPVGRPRGAVWRSLQADGVVWEGQVLLVGDDVDLAARMIVTYRRVVFVRGGEVVLEMPRGWLRPEPVLRRDGVLELFVAMPGGNFFDEPIRIPLRMREGHPAAGHIIAMLGPSGVRHIAPDALSGLERAREATPPPRFGGFWDDEPDSLTNGDGLVGTVDDFDQHLDPPPVATEHADWAPIEPPGRVMRVPSNPPQRPSAGGFPIAGMLPRDQRRSPWRLLVRVAALTVLLATAAALGAGRLDLQVPGSANEPILVAPTATIPAPTTPTDVPEAALASDQESAITIGVGGPAAQVSAADATATAAAAATPAETPVPSLATTAPAIPTPAATPTPLAVPTATPQPTTSAAPAATTQGSASPAAAAGTPGESAATPMPSAPTQAAAVDPGEPPAQEIVVGPLRLTLLTALRAESLPRYALPPGSGEWVLLTARMTNESDTAASLAMSDLRLFDRGTATVVDLDTGTDVVATLAGFDPAWSNEDAIPVAPGESVEALLLYLLPPGGSDDLTLLVGQTSIDLGPSLALGEAAPPATPDLLQATVVDVLDGSRLSVEVGGRRETVQYLGLQSPVGDACFAAEATTANSALVQGEQVWLERQATDRDADGDLMRDVWIADANGDRALVAARLLETGAATPAPAPPDTRYQAWLQAAAALARTIAAGLWAACGDVSA
ncbi:MAG: thermonuclease family protein [Thermomicrobiales bacterium]|nr:thermonuclease family protein [Thermomicrobiales bacterium]